MDYNGLQWTAMDYNGLQSTTIEYNGPQWTTMDFKADRSDPNLAIQCNKYRRYTIGRFVMGVGEEGVMASPNIF